MQITRSSIDTQKGPADRGERLVAVLERLADDHVEQYAGGRSG
jgi:hypothetical protein